MDPKSKLNSVPLMLVEGLKSWYQQFLVIDDVGYEDLISYVRIVAVVVKAVVAVAAAVADAVVDDVVVDSPILFVMVEISQHY